jgi:hypothetical protein
MPTMTQTTTGFDAACTAIREGRATPWALWAILTSEHERDGYALKPAPWEGPGEYQALAYSDGRMAFVRLPDFQPLPNVTGASA